MLLFLKYLMLLLNISVILSVKFLIYPLTLPCSYSVNNENLHYTFIKSCHIIVHSFRVTIMMYECTSFLLVILKCALIISWKLLGSFIKCRQKIVVLQLLKLRYLKRIQFIYLENPLWISACLYVIKERRISHSGDKFKIVVKIM